MNKGIKFFAVVVLFIASNLGYSQEFESLAGQREFYKNQNKEEADKFLQKRESFKNKRALEDNKRQQEQEELQKLTGFTGWFKRKWNLWTHESENARDARRKREDANLDIEEQRSFDSIRQQLVSKKRTAIMKILNDERIQEVQFRGITQLRILMNEDSTVEQRAAALEELKKKISIPDQTFVLNQDTRVFEEFVMGTTDVTGQQENTVRTELSSIPVEVQQNFVTLAAAWAKEEAVRMIEDLQSDTYKLTKPALMANDVHDIMGMISLKAIFKRYSSGVVRSLGNLKEMLRVEIVTLIELVVFAWRKATGKYKQVKTNRDLMDKIETLFPKSYALAQQRRLLSFNPSQE